MSLFFGDGGKDDEKGSISKSRGSSYGVFGKSEEKGAVDGALQDLEDGCSLTWEQRFWGFVICIEKA